jgi:hypothetical protein
VLARAVEAVLRGSLFRSGYELLFVPMDPVEKRRAKTFLDVTCDRGGDAIGALLVQAVLLTGAAYVASELLAIAIAMSVAGWWIARRLDALYLGVVERQLVRHVEQSPVIVGSETGWTVLDIAPSETVLAPRREDAETPRREEDPKVRLLGDLRSGDRTRVARALDQVGTPDRMHVAQIIELLAWDDLVGPARTVLERVAASHIGLLVDALLDPASDFAIRRRIPRILGTVATARAVDGLLRGLEDTRFEVRYQCGRALEKLVARSDGALAVDSGAVYAVVERELSVSASIWQGHRLIDRVDADDDVGPDAGGQLNLAHVFTLLATVLPREPLQVAYQGLRSDHAGLRALAIEYLEGVLPAPIQLRLWAILEVRR